MHCQTPEYVKAGAQTNSIRISGRIGSVKLEGSAGAEEMEFHHVEESRAFPGNPPHHAADQGEGCCNRCEHDE